MSKFGDSPIISDHETRIAALESAEEAQSYSTRQDVREIVGYSDGDRVLCLQNNYIYKFDAAETTADDDDLYLTPDDITEPAPGRWVKTAEYALVNHTHSEYAEKVSGATAGNFTSLQADGDLQDSGKKASDFIEKKGPGLDAEVPVFTSTGDIESSGQTIATLIPGITDKMDKITGITAPDVGKFIMVDADGNASLGSNKPVDFVANIQNELRIFPNSTQTLEENTWRFYIDGNSLKLQRYNGASWDFVHEFAFGSSPPSW